MAKLAKAQANAPSLVDQINIARADFEVAREAAETFANSENENLASDDGYASWLRKLRLAEIDRDRLASLVKTLEAAIKVEKAQRELYDYEQRYKAAAARNEDVAAMFRSDLPKAWSTISGILKAAALAEIETEALLKTMPPGFTPPYPIGDPEACRRRPSFSEKVLATENVTLWVDERGNLFADQSRRPTKKAMLKPFRRTSYLAARRGDSPMSFYREFVFPRLDAYGGPLFDGRLLRSAADVLCALAEPRPAPPARTPLMRIEATDGPAARPADDMGPPVLS